MTKKGKHTCKANFKGDSTYSSITKKYKTIYLKSGYNKKLSKHKGSCAFATNDLKVGNHKVVISAANKNYQASKKTFIKVTKSIKKRGPLLFLITGGKLKIYRGF